jgi:hypothetical protein
MVLLALLGHKCGSTYVYKVLEEVCRKEKIPFHHFEEMIYKEDFPKSIFSIQLVPGTLYVLNNSNYRKLRQAVRQPYRGFHVIRDPRDVIVSGYFSHRNSHPIKGKWETGFLQPHRKWLSEVSEAEGLLKEIEIGYALNGMAKWNFSDPDILELRFESLVSEPQKWFSDIFRHLDLSVKPKTLEKVVEKNSFQKLAKGRKRGEEDVKSHYRKGIHGDWKNYFNEEHKAFFKEKWGQLVLDLGYEENPDW